MDSILAKRMSFQACHGVLAREKIVPQNFVVDLEMYLDLHKAGTSDNLMDTVDYEQVFKLVERIVTGDGFDLIEALAEEIARALLAAFPLMQGVEVTLYKPQAPVQGEFEHFAVKIKRFQK